MHDITILRTTILAGLLGCSAAIAQEPEIDDPAVLSPGEQKVIQKLAGSFEDFAGDDAAPLIEALRTGSDLSYEVVKEIEVEVRALDDAGNPAIEKNTDGTPKLDDEGNEIPIMTTKTETITETVVVENTAGAMGFGNAKITMLLAERMLAGEPGNLANISGALFGTESGTADGILQLRAEGAGWGEISKELLGTSLGSLMSAKNTGKRPDKGTDADPETETGEVAGLRGSRQPKASSNRSDRRSKAESLPKPAKRERTAKPVKLDRPAKRAKVERPAKLERPSRPERPARPEKPERPEKPQRPEKPARPERPNR